MTIVIKLRSGETIGFNASWFVKNGKFVDVGYMRGDEQARNVFLLTDIKTAWVDGRMLYGDSLMFADHALRR